MNRAQIIAETRRRMATLGFPLDEYTDKEVEAGVMPVGWLSAAARFTGEEAAEVMAEARQILHGQLPGAVDLAAFMTPNRPR